ncbi:MULTISPECIES: metallophosphoesterase family protein [Inquilinus]|uniref:Calcineurin-like phosphoesterase family protein n=1 Tax=Inquilinus ginsengisoli TaxID=363840 RepID=A0ABU1JPA2_9PROT|nr:metallophosphoesterase family protein [Inquilinus ginsengisoli]MDR6290446.1 calcineurin-like phosphoesterase family protein [Inquilinus ginsengisoli]
MTVFFTSDTHFGDSRVLRIDRRPFPSVAAHDDALVALWNETVGPEDEVWHLGDFALGPSAEAVAALLERLHGRKHLISGNNDGPGTLAAPGWASVQAYAELRLDGRHLILCHYPFRTWNQIGRGSLDLHGHSHGKLTPATRQYDVGVDVQELRPATLDQILARKRRRATVAAKLTKAE